jgi:O-antigen/teichoic acid export membrane protein
MLAAGKAVGGTGGSDSGIGALKRRALSLGAANAFDYAVQFLLPIVLARCLDATQFGQYRLMWLVVITVMAIAPMYMPQGLYYFLPRSEPAAKRLYVHQTLLFLTMAGLVSAWLVSPWNPLLPASVGSLLEFGGLVPVFVALWLSSYLLDLLPTVEERIRLQAGITISMSALRAVVLALGAFLTGDLHVLIWLLVALVTLKLALLMVYIRRFHGLQGPWFERRAFADQARHAAPFGASSALYGLRAQADQWVAASLFSLGSFAAFSVGAVLGPLINLLRQSVNHTFLPSMSRTQAGDDVKGMLKLNSQANAMVAVVVYPVLAFAFVFAEEMVSIVYTSTYLEAAPVMRMYILGLIPMVVELVSVMMLLREGGYALKVNFAVIFASLFLSWFCAQRFGLPGAAAGSVFAVYVDRLANLHRISVRTGIAIGRLQDWGSLGRLLLFSTLAAALAWAMTDRYLHLDGNMLRLAVGGVVLAGAYGAMLAVGGTGGPGWAGLQHAGGTDDSPRKI